MSRDPNEPKPESLGQQRVNSKIDASLIEDPAWCTRSTMMIQASSDTSPTRP